MMSVFFDHLAEKPNRQWISCQFTDGPGRKLGFLGYFGYLRLSSPAFINPTFRFLPIVNKKTWITRNPRFSNIGHIDFCLMSNMKSWTSRIRDFQISDFQIFAHSQIIKKIEFFKHLNFRLFADFQIRKLGSLPGRGFQWTLQNIDFHDNLGPISARTPIFARSLGYIIMKVGSKCKNVILGDYRLKSENFLTGNNS